MMYNNSTSKNYIMKLNKRKKKIRKKYMHNIQMVTKSNISFSFIITFREYYIIQKIR